MFAIAPESDIQRQAFDAILCHEQTLPPISLVSDSHSDHGTSNFNHCLALTCLARVWSI